ncbi:MAG: tyrosine-protein phosphatase [Acidobacteriaceae bacterium]
MIDIHHHLLFGLDDGPETIEGSLAMAEMAISEGITHIACTPHANYHWNFDPAVNAARTEELRSRLGGRVTLGSGCDFHMSYDNVADAIANPTKYTLNGKSYLLIELPDFALPPNLSETYYELRLAGMTPILTHPERNPTLQKQPEKIAEWLRGGMIVQITAGSLTGRFGKLAERMAHKLLEDGWVHFIATDAHNTESRPPQIKEVMAMVAKRYGAETAERLCISNPRVAFEGLAWPEQPEPKGVFVDDLDGQKNWWQKLVGR